MRGDGDALASGSGTERSVDAESKIGTVSSLADPMAAFANDPMRGFEAESAAVLAGVPLLGAADRSFGAVVEGDERPAALDVLAVELDPLWTPRLDCNGAKSALVCCNTADASAFASDRPRATISGSIIATAWDVDASVAVEVATGSSCTSRLSCRWLLAGKSVGDREAAGS